MTLDFFEKFTLGRPVVKKSMLGTDFAVFPDALLEVRNCLLPLGWYAEATSSPEKHMDRTSLGWVYWTTKSQLLADIVDTLIQMETGYGSVREVRVVTLQRLVTQEEWEWTLEDLAAARAVLDTQ